MFDESPATPEMAAEPTSGNVATESMTVNEFWDNADVDAPEEMPESLSRPRGPDGKFIPKGEEVEGTEGAADEVAPAAIPAVEGQEPVNPSAFKYRAMGQTHELADVTVTEDGSVLWPAAKVGDLRAALNARHLAEGEMQPLIERYKAENHALRQQTEQRSLSEAKYETMANQLSALLLEGDEATAIEKFFELRGAFPSMMSQAEVQYWKDQATRGPTQPEAAESPYREEAPALPTVEQALSVTLGTLEEFKLDHQFRDITPEDWQQLEASIQRTPYTFLRPATAEEAETYGVVEGQIVQDLAAYTAHVTQLAEQRRQSRETARRSATLAAQTARRTTPQVTTPPTAGGAKAPPKGEKRISSKADMEDYWDSDEV